MRAEHDLGDISELAVLNGGVDQLPKIRAAGAASWASSGAESWGI